MKETKFLDETCVVCGFCHRYGKARPAIPVAHFHWGLSRTEHSQIDELGVRRIAHRTVCAAHFLRADELYAIGRTRLSPEYAVEGSLNAPLPLEHIRASTLAYLDGLYEYMFSRYEFGIRNSVFEQNPGALT